MRVISRLNGQGCDSQPLPVGVSEIRQRLTATASSNRIIIQPKTKPNQLFFLAEMVESEKKRERKLAEQRLVYSL